MMIIKSSDDDNERLKWWSLIIPARPRHRCCGSRGCHLLYHDYDHHVDGDRDVDIDDHDEKSDNFYEKSDNFYEDCDETYEI